VDSVRPERLLRILKILWKHSKPRNIRNGKKHWVSWHNCRYCPNVGFIGTIAGVIKIFYNISLADNISIGIIAGGLYQKMICSGTGLIVGVIAYSCYHYLQMMIDRYSIDMQRQVMRL